MTVENDLPISIHLSSLPGGPRRMNTNLEGIGTSVISPIWRASDSRMNAETFEGKFTLIQLFFSKDNVGNRSTTNHMKKTGTFKKGRYFILIS